MLGQRVHLRHGDRSEREQLDHDGGNKPCHVQHAVLLGQRGRAKDRRIDMRIR